MRRISNSLVKTLLLAMACITLAAYLAYGWEPVGLPDTTIYGPPPHVTGQYHDGTVYGKNNEPKYYIRGDKIYDAKNPGHVVYQIAPRVGSDSKDKNRQ